MSNQSLLFGYLWAILGGNIVVVTSLVFYYYTEWPQSRRKSIKGKNVYRKTAARSIDGYLAKYR